MNITKAPDFADHPPVHLDTLELTGGEVISRDDTRFNLTWASENSALVRRFDLAMDFKSPTRILLAKFRLERARLVRTWVDPRGYTTRYFGQGDFLCRVYDRDFDALYPTGLTRVEFQVRSTDARRYLQGTNWGPPDEGAIFAAMARRMFARFPHGMPDQGVYRQAPPPKPRISKEVLQFIAMKRIIRKTAALPPDLLAELARELQGLSDRSAEGVSHVPDVPGS